MSLTLALKKTENTVKDRWDRRISQEHFRDAMEAEFKKLLNTKKYNPDNQETGIYVEPRFYPVGDNPMRAKFIVNFFAFDPKGGPDIEFMHITFHYVDETITDSKYRNSNVGPVHVRFHHSIKGKWGAWISYQPYLLGNGNAYYKEINKSKHLEKFLKDETNEFLHRQKFVRDRIIRVLDKFGFK